MTDIYINRNTEGKKKHTAICNMSSKGEVHCFAVWDYELSEDDLYVVLHNGSYPNPRVHVDFAEDYVEIEQLALEAWFGKSEPDNKRREAVMATKAKKK